MLKAFDNLVNLLKRGLITARGITIILNHDAVHYCQYLLEVVIYQYNAGNHK